MNYGAIKYCDIANGIGIRTVLFVSGCTHHCKGCFQPETWDFSYGQPYTSETEQAILASLAPSYIHGLTLLGGEPMEPDNQRALLPLLRRLKADYPTKTVWCYSGYTYEELTGVSRARCEVTDEMLGYIDVLVDGEFVLEKRNISLRFRGSDNQRLIDLPRTREQGTVVLWEG
jgi:anaerobic ribonucleoside-triphosphate reductase activating protein